MLPTDVSDPEQVDAAADAVESELGPIDVWVNVAFTSVFARFAEISPAEFKRVTEVAYLGYVYGTMAALRRMAPRDRGDDRAGRLGARLPGHPAAERLLRRQARDPGLQRGAALRAAAREERRPRHDAPDARGQHPAVRLGPLAAAASRPARPAHLPARGDRPRRALRGRPPQASRVLDRGQHRRHARRQRARARHARPLPGEDRLRLPADRREPPDPTPRQPVGACRWRGRPRLHVAWQLRRRGEGPIAAAARVAPPRSDRRGLATAGIVGGLLARRRSRR